jgi:hypothetical protein
MSSLFLEIYSKVPGGELGATVVRLPWDKLHHLSTTKSGHEVQQKIFISIFQIWNKFLFQTTLKEKIVESETI